MKITDTLEYKEPYILPDESLKSGEVRYRNKHDRIVELSSITIYPNPAREFVIIEYALEGDGKGYLINILDANGGTRQTIKPDNNRGFIVINTQYLETGNYISVVYRNGTPIGSSKFIIVR